MHARSSLQLTLLMLRASAALALTAAPLHLAFDGALPKLVAASALADSNDHGGGDRDSGDGNSGDRDSDDDDDGDDHGDGDDDDDQDDDDHGGSGGGHGDDDGNDDDGDDHVNPRTGDRVEVDGDNVQVLHPDGTKEEIDSGVYEMKDARGRTIIERRATQADIDRLTALAG